MKRVLVALAKAVGALVLFFFLAVLYLGLWWLTLPLTVLFIAFMYFYDEE